MLPITRSDCPEVLVKNSKSWLREYKLEPNKNSKKYRYRHKDIKSTIRADAHSKCMFCECKIGASSPGDIEHFIPCACDDDLRFEWENLGFCCTECNRRKGTYYDQERMLLNPYTENVEERVVHQGPLLTWRVGDHRAEITVRLLELDGVNREELVKSKVSAIRDLSELLERIESEESPVLRELLERRLQEMTSNAAEYAGMLRSILAAKRIPAP